MVSIGSSNACAFCGTNSEKTIRLFPNLNTKSHDQQILEEGLLKVINGFKTMSNKQKCEPQQVIQSFGQILEELETTTVSETTQHQIQNDLRKALVRLLHMKELKQKQYHRIQMLKLKLKKANKNRQFRRVKHCNAHLLRTESHQWTIT